MKIMIMKPAKMVEVHIYIAFQSKLFKGRLKFSKPATKTQKQQSQKQQTQ